MSERIVYCGCCKKDVTKHNDVMSVSCLAFLTGMVQGLESNLTESRNGSS